MLVTVLQVHSWVCSGKRSRNVSLIDKVANDLGSVYVSRLQCAEGRPMFGLFERPIVVGKGWRDRYSLELMRVAGLFIWFSHKVFHTGLLSRLVGSRQDCAFKNRADIDRAVTRVDLWLLVAKQDVVHDALDIFSGDLFAAPVFDTVSALPAAFTHLANVSNRRLPWWRQSIDELPLLQVDLSVALDRLRRGPI